MARLKALKESAKAAAAAVPKPKPLPPSKPEAKQEAAPAAAAAHAPPASPTPRTGGSGTVPARPKLAAAAGRQARSEVRPPEEAARKRGTSHVGRSGGYKD